VRSRVSVVPPRSGRRGLLAACLAVPALGVFGPAAALGAGGCADPLVVHRPDGSTGEVTAVAITSQALERDTPGWSSVGWEAAPGTRVTEVVVVTAEGERHHAGTPAGTATDALELRFCGTVEVASDVEDGSGLADAARGRASADDVAEERTTPVRFDTDGGDGDAAIGTAPASVLGAAAGLVAGAVVLLMSRSGRRDPETGQ
jgi:hypothetical protein